jgi:rubredoxin
MNETARRRYQCVLCGEIYDEARGAPESGISPGTRWEDLPDDWVCSACGAPRSEYVLLKG